MNISYTVYIPLLLYTIYIYIFLLLLVLILSDCMFILSHSRYCRYSPAGMGSRSGKLERAQLTVTTSGNSNNRSLELENSPLGFPVMAWGKHHFGSQVVRDSCIFHGGAVLWFFVHGSLQLIVVFPKRIATNDQGWFFRHIQAWKSESLLIAGCLKETIDMSGLKTFEYHRIVWLCHQ